MIDLRNTKAAFRLRSNNELRKAYWMFRLISIPWLVKSVNFLLRIVNSIRLPVGWIVKPTIYKQFCGGVTLEKCLPVVEKLASCNVKSILDYSVEGKDDDADIEKALQETLRSIEFSGKHSNIPFTVFKPTAFVKPWALEELSKNNKPSNKAISEGVKFRDRINILCRNAHLVGKPILIDAEYSYFQNYIDEVVIDMMKTYNRKQAIVFNTYQMYLKNRMEILKKDSQTAEKEKFYLGAKFVRGAYMEKERARAAKMKYPDPIHPDKDATDRSYDEALRFSVKNIQHISIFNGTHNENSSLLLAILLKESNLKPDDQRVWFSQLYGMSDHISFNLADAGYNVAKYVPYGPVRQVLPYLIRRAEENTSVAGQTGRELEMIIKELKTRGNNHAQ